MAKETMTMTMKMEDIRRESLSLPKPTELNKSLAEKAVMILGYAGLSMAIESMTATKDSEDTEKAPILARALLGLEMHPLNAVDVNRYQTEMLKQRTAELMKEWVGKTDKIEDYTYFSGPRWLMTKVEEYKLPIPEFVLNKAIQIKETLPECEIYIQHLEDHPDPFLLVTRTVDHKYTGGSYKVTVEKFWIDVWAEPKFEGSL